MCLIPGNGGNLGKHNTPTPVLSLGSPTHHHGINTCEPHAFAYTHKAPSCQPHAPRLRRVGGTHLSDDRPWKMELSRDNITLLARESHLPAGQLLDADEACALGLHTYYNYNP